VKNNELLEKVLKSIDRTLVKLNIDRKDNVQKFIDLKMGVVQVYEKFR